MAGKANDKSGGASRSGNANYHPTIPGLEVDWIDTGLYMEFAYLGNLRDKMGKEFVTVLKDDIKVSSSDFEEHVEHMTILCQAVRDAGFQFKIKKIDESGVEIIWGCIAEGLITKTRTCDECNERFPTMHTLMFTCIQRCVCNDCMGITELKNKNRRLKELVSKMDKKDKKRKKDKKIKKKLKIPGLFPPRSPGSGPRRRRLASRQERSERGWTSCGAVAAATALRSPAATRGDAAGAG